MRRAVLAPLPPPSRESPLPAPSCWPPTDRDRDGDRAENQLNRRRRKELASSVGPQAGGEPAGCDPARQEDDVPGHVGHEHVAEPQVGDRIVEAGHDRQHDQQRR